MPAATREPAFDRAEFRSRYADDAELAQVALDAYRGTTSPILDRLSAAIERRDREGIVLAAHTLKGASAMVSAAWLGALATRLEDRARQNDCAGAEQVCDEMRAAFAAFCEETESFQLG